MRRLNAALAGTALASRYWIVGGLLLGLVRCERPLENDLDDVDFAFLSSDREAFLSAIPVIIAAGFRPALKWVSNRGRATQWVFARRLVRYEFFEVDPEPQAFRFYGYFPERSGNWSGQLYETEFRVPRHALAAGQLFGCEWMLPADAEAALDALYGDAWRAPSDVFGSRHWNTGLDSPAVTRREPWQRRPISWDGSVDIDQTTTD